MHNSKIFLRTAIAYTRSYSKESLNTFSLEEQEKAIYEYAEKNGYRILKIFKEQEKSGRDFNRPEFQSMLEYCRTQKVKIRFCIVCNLKRLSSDFAGLKRIRSFLRKSGIKLISLENLMVKGVVNRR